MQWSEREKKGPGQEEQQQQNKTQNRNQWFSAHHRPAGHRGARDLSAVCRRWRQTAARGVCTARPCEYHRLLCHV